MEKKLLETIAESVDTLKRIRIVLGGVSIEAKSASDVAAIDNALGNMAVTFDRILRENANKPIVDNSTISD